MRVDASNVLGQGGLKTKQGTDSAADAVKGGAPSAGAGIAGEEDLSLARQDVTRGFSDKSLAPFAAKLAELNIPVTEDTAKNMRELMEGNPKLSMDEAAFLASNKLGGDGSLARAALELTSGGEKTHSMINRIISTLGGQETAAGFENADNFRISSPGRAPLTELIAAVVKNASGMLAAAAAAGGAEGLQGAQHQAGTVASNIAPPIITYNNDNLQLNTENLQQYTQEMFKAGDGNESAALNRARGEGSQTIDNRGQNPVSSSPPATNAQGADVAAAGIRAGAAAVIAAHPETAAAGNAAAGNGAQGTAAPLQPETAPAAQPGMEAAPHAASSETAPGTQSTVPAGQAAVPPAQSVTAAAETAAQPATPAVMPEGAPAAPATAPAAPPETAPAAMPATQAAPPETAAAAGGQADTARDAGMFLQSAVTRMLSEIPQFQGTPQSALDRFSGMLLRIARDTGIGEEGSAPSNAQQLAEQLEKMFTKISRNDNSAGARLREAREELFARLTLVQEEISRASRPVGEQLFAQTQKLMDHVKLLNNIEQFAYMQLPVQLTEERKTAELYVFKRKGGKRADPDNVNILLSIDLEFMGHWEALLNIKGKDVSLNMEVAGEAEKEHFNSSTVLLHEMLSEAGFKLVNTHIKISEEETNPVTALLALDRFTGKTAGGRIDFFL